MATLALSVVGQFAGGMIGGPIGATIGRALGAVAGSAIDAALFGPKEETADRPMFDVRLGGSSEGGGITRLYGWGRLAGNIIWARELLSQVTETSGSKGFSPPTQAEEEVFASFAVAFCEGPVARLGRIWADGQLLDTRGLNLRFYAGDETQMPDSLIEAVQGAGNAPAYRGLCYLVVENLPLSLFGNRIPQLSAELCRVVGDLEPNIRAITVIPGATEFGYDPVPRVRVTGLGSGVSENAHQLAGVSDWTVSIDELVALCPNLENVALVVSWFGDDLRCGHCSIGPRVEGATRTIAGTSWSVAGLERHEVPVVSSHGGGPAYGGTPSDNAVIAAIADLKARGLKVTLYPFILMDIPSGNGKPDPYGWGEQASYPWRGRVTCHPALWQPETANGTADADAQVAAFVPGYRAQILHYARMAKDHGVDALLIGSELVGLTGVQGAAGDFPFVDALVMLAEDVRAIVGSSVKLTYAADWSEYSGVQRDGGKIFHLDPLWASDDIDAIGIDCYFPLSDWRDEEGQADAAHARTGYELDYLRGNLVGGEGYDWYYASEADRRAQVRSPISDGAHFEHWIWRYKDIAAFWGEEHFDRPSGVRAETPTAWVSGSKPIWLTEVGCGAVDKGANQPNIFGDEKSAEDGRPYFSTGVPDGLIQRQLLRAHFAHWDDAAMNPAGMVALDRIYCWTWDARPYPSFPNLTTVWADGDNHRTGHWLTGRLGALSNEEMMAAIAQDFDCAVAGVAAAPLIAGLEVGAPMTARGALEPVLDMTGQSLVARNGAVVGTIARGPAQLTIALDDLVDKERAAVLSRRRGQAEEKADLLSLGHFDRDKDYLAATATAVRPGTGPLVSMRFPVTLDSASARQASEHLLNVRGAAGDQIEFALPPNALALEPGDIVGIEGLSEGPFEISEIRDGAVRKITAKALARGDAVAVGVEVSRSRATPPQPDVTPHFVLAELSPSPEDPLRSRIAVAAFARPWPGSIRITDAVTGAALGQLNRPSVLGALAEPLGVGDHGTWDEDHSLDVQLLSGHLTSASEAAVLAGSNRLAVQTNAGTWEIVGFCEAELVSPNRYVLSKLWRGAGGTDWAIGPTDAGNTVMLIDDRPLILPVDAYRLGTEIELRCYAGPTDMTGMALSIAPDPAPVLPLAPGRLAAEREPNDDIIFTWKRRSRAVGDGWSGANPPLEYIPEAYELSVVSSGIEVRRFAVSTASVVYSKAHQIADFGGLASSFTWRVVQVSPLLGAGHKAEAVFDD
ncbi:glycoside hydrolase TIM-barrel-like domain-containing protein [Devosia sp. MC532]|uniref:baseplate multidomain protein megatron n=1 Tax=Devosia sp. MC532 TaxID=2799788 RepID=UPI0018F7765D|nr:glycoside hydrolase/phage tail family protein [Devosia sp. MC532]MBJ7578018.1 glycoside hydrolase TIM-barrel-like domain-containing protein [Devosia sp. MC532]